MGKAGRAFVEKEMSLVRLAQAHERLYQRLTQSPTDVLCAEPERRIEPPRARRLAP
jgi:hypothetical protein